MINTGIIYLIDREGLAVTAKHYKYPGARKDIQKEWKQLYAAAYKTCAIQIAPYTDITLVNPDGTNKYQRTK